MKELIIDGVRFKRLPGSNYYVGPNGLLITLRPMVPDKYGRYKLRRNSKRVYRTVDQLSHIYDKL